ncbi:hypothetical protein BOO71_0013564 [Deinococcus marmoris]|uniref:Uncharacterized protein n=1 Tax=Deinococcus marmoris TaxID=249408 RepID=A0A1U7NSQ4_9DEIO|nr:hypothetical protein BOO71_0013564 [Deinococcus marmoris]
MRLDGKYPQRAALPEDGFEKILREIYPKLREMVGIQTLHP